MTRKVTVLSCFLLSFVLSFLSIGYATITGSLTIKGKVESVVPEGLFITDVQELSQSRLDVRQVSFVPFSTTVNTKLSKQDRNNAGIVKYRITVKNNTKYEHAYRDIYYQSGNVNNNLINKLTSSTQTPPSNKISVYVEFPVGKVVEPNGGTIYFDVTYTLGSSNTSINRNNTYENLINYQFGINVETEAIAREAIHDKFIDVLNTSSTYEELVDVLDNKFDGYQEWTSNYVGNVGDASSDDAMAVNTLFAGQLNMIINGETREAKVIIKHENIDNNEMTGDDYTATNQGNGQSITRRGCEMTLYLTTDTLYPAGKDAEVYVCVFTCDRDENGNMVGDWYRIGDTYRGTANVVGYNGEADGTGSFVTDNWVSTATTYTPHSEYSYYVPAGQSIKTITQEYDARAIEVFQTLLDEAKAIIDDTTYAGTGITIIEDTYKMVEKYFTYDQNGRPIAKQDTLRVWLMPAMKEMEHAIETAREEIDRINGITGQTN